jgi:hypothetical protein
MASSPAGPRVHAWKCGWYKEDQSEVFDLLEPLAHAGDGRKGELDGGQRRPKQRRTKLMSEGLIPKIEEGESFRRVKGR